LPELLLAFGLGLGVCALMLQSVLAEGHNSQRLSRLLRERLVAERAFDLLRSDLQRATAAATAAAPADAACNLGGRAVVLHLDTPEGAVTYSLGRPAEPIWRGQVLMRCGPAYDLTGVLSEGAVQNRVLLDALVEQQGLRLERPAAGLLALRLERLVGPALPLRQELQTEAPFIAAAP